MNLASGWIWELSSGEGAPPALVPPFPGRLHSVSHVSLAAFRALLQIRAVRKKPGALSPLSFSPVLAQTLDHDEHSVRGWGLSSCSSSRPGRAGRGIPTSGGQSGRGEQALEARILARRLSPVC